jgi:hypothetical protein
LKSEIHFFHNSDLSYRTWVNFSFLVSKMGQSYPPFIGWVGVSTVYIGGVFVDTSSWGYVQLMESMDFAIPRTLASLGPTTGRQE